MAVTLLGAGILLTTLTAYVVVALPLGADSSIDAYDTVLSSQPGELCLALLSLLDHFHYL